MGAKNSKKPVIPEGIDPSLRRGNPHYGYRMQLYCQTGHHLIILPDGKVKGSNEENDPHATLEFTSAGWGEVRIRAVETNFYLAMNKKGRLYGEVLLNPREEGTIFIESMVGSYNSYLSRKYAHLGWYVGIKKSGKQKPGPQTKYGHKSTQFLPRRLKEPPLRVYRQTAV